MEVQSPVMKRHYDLSMSRRTRKLNLPVAVQGNNDDDDDDEKFKAVVSPKKSDDNNNNHKSLKQLINISDEKNSSRNKCNGEGSVVEGGRNSLGEHFNEEEKQLQLVVVPQPQKENNNNLNGLNFKKLVRRYAKVLGHFITKKPQSGNKPVFKLST